MFDTLRSSRKYPNIIAPPYAPLVIGLEGEATIQYEGTAGLTRDRRRLEAYLSAFPEGRRRALSPDVVHFDLRPTWIRYSEYGGTSRRIEEVALPCA